jgi:hypothetical protein
VGRLEGERQNGNSNRAAITQTWVYGRAEIADETSVADAHLKLDRRRGFCEGEG